MRAIDYLPTVAEIAITIAGFAGIVAVVRSSGDMSIEQTRRVVYLVLVCTVTVVTALLPGVLTDLGLSASASAAVSSAILGISVLGLVGSFLWNIFTGGLNLIFPKLTYLVAATPTVTATVLVLSSIGVVFSPSYGLLLLGLIVNLLLALWIFVATMVWARG